MSYLGEPDDDDRHRDDRTGERRRSTQPARPAWDAATYGTPEDLRRSRPRHGRDTPPRYDPPPVPYEPAYEPAPYEPPHYDQPAYDQPPYEPPAYEPPPYAYEPPPPSYDPGPSRTDYGDPASWPGGAAPPAVFAEGRYAKREERAPASPAGASEGWFEPPPPRPPELYLSSLEIPVEPAAAHPVERYPAGLAAPPAPPRRERNLGRNLPAAIGVGVLLGAIAVASLFVWRPAFLAVLVAAVGVAVWELVRAIRTSGANPPLVPLVAGGVLMTGLAWWGQADALTFGLVVTVLAVMIWRLADGTGGYARDVTAATLVAVYVPFLAGFAALLATASDGDLRVLVTLAGVVLSDTGGYIAGVLFGKHPMAPSVSPKKSWEGLAGSLVATAVGGALLLYFLFGVTFWLGAVFGLAVSAAAVLGDLGESMIKRDLGVKDMSQLLPGHGGLMDRLDSIVFAAPTAYVLLVLLAPPL
jgi:phosphatidate cytidylyltransferase